MNTLLSTKINTYAHTTTYLTDKLMNSLKQIIISAGLDLGKFRDDWDSTERAIKTWVKSKHLQKITLEIFKFGTRTLVTRWDLDIEYSNGSGEESFWTDTNTIKFAIKKCGSIPDDCTYDIIITNASGYPHIEGWGSCKLRSTNGLRKRSAGTVIDACRANASTSYWS